MIKDLVERFMQAKPALEEKLKELIEIKQGEGKGVDLEKHIDAVLAGKKA